MNQEVELYHHYGFNDELLYVGISLSTVNRLSQHKKSPWRSEISYVKIVGRFKTREDALKAEQTAICKLNPIYNVVRPKPELSFF